MHAILRTASPRDPFRGAFDDLVRDYFVARPAPDAATVKPRVDVYDLGNTFELVADLPGVAKQDIQVRIEGDRVELEATSSNERAQTQQDKSVLRERAPRRFARSFVLPTEIDAAASQARYEDGVLTLVLPKRSAGTAHKVTVQ